MKKSKFKFNEERARWRPQGANLMSPVSSL